MKYFKEHKAQFDVLRESIELLNKYIDLSEVNPSHIHFVVYQQFANGQKHNRLAVNDGKLIKAFKLVNGELVRQAGAFLIKKEFDFKLYPDGLNDSHVETAVKRILKSL